MLEALLRSNPWFEPLARQQARETHRTFVDHAGDWAWQNLPGLYQSVKPAVPFEMMEIGMESAFEMRMSRWATWYFACCTGDFNRVHFDPRGVAPFKGPICHGMHLASLISRGLGTELPGQGTIFSRLNNLVWKGPVYIGERVKVTSAITKLDPRRETDGLNRVSFSSNIRNEAGKVVVEAEPIAYVQ